MWSSLGTSHYNYLGRSSDRPLSHLVCHARSLGNSALLHSPLLPPIPHYLLPYLLRIMKIARGFVSVVRIHRASEEGSSRKTVFIRPHRLYGFTDVYSPMEAFADTAVLGTGAEWKSTGSGAVIPISYNVTELLSRANLVSIELGACQSNIILCSKRRITPISRFGVIWTSQSTYPF